MLNRVRTDPRYESAKDAMENILAHIPFGDRILDFGKHAKDSLKEFMVPTINSWLDETMGPVNRQ